MRLCVAVVAAVVGCLGSLVVAPSAAAGTGPALTGLRMSKSAVTVFELRTETVTISIDINDPDGVRWGYGDFQGTDSYWTPTVVLKRTDGTGFLTVQNFQRVSGDDTSGTWAAMWPVTSRQGGTWEVVSARLEDNTSADTVVDPRTLGLDPRVTVNASDPPQLTFSISPAILHRGQSLTVAGTFRVPSGPLVHQDLWLPNNEFCGLAGLPEHLTTNATGGWSVTVANDPSAPVYPSAVCVERYVPANGDEWNVEQTNSDWVASVSGVPRRQYLFLSRSVAHASVPVGSADAVTGNIWPFGQFLTGRVLLQRLVGRTWRTVNFEPVRTSGRFSLTANPPYRGRNVYRVVKSSDSCFPRGCTFLGTSSAAFTILGT